MVAEILRLLMSEQYGQWGYNGLTRHVAYGIRKSRAKKEAAAIKDGYVVLESEELFRAFMQDAPTVA